MRLALSLDALVVIDAIARHSSFAKAAAELNRVPSALSYTVTKLEQRLGLQLFDRSSRRVRITPEGSELLQEGRRLLRNAASIERRLGQRSAGWETELRIAVDTIFGVQCLFPLIAEFDGLASGTRISLHEEAVSGCWDALESDRADLIIAGLGAGGLPSGSGIVVHCIGSLKFDFAVASSHPLAKLAPRQSKPVSDDELRPFRAISVADSSTERPTGSIGLLTGQDRLTVARMEDKLAAQVAGLGIGFLPHFMAEPEFRTGTLVKLDVLQPRPTAVFAIAHRQNGLGKAGRWFASRMQKDANVFPGLSESW